jgi:ATP-dependent DNA helicase RecG
MDFIDKNLKIIADCIQNNTYQEVETERFELKDLSSGWGDEFYKSVCGFLNTNGGTVVIGIKDKNNVKPPEGKYYKFLGFDYSSKNDDHLGRVLPNIFKDRKQNPLNLSNYISFETRDFLGGKVAVVYVTELADDEKYVYHKNEVYIRSGTGERKLSIKEIEEYEELKNDIIKHQELTIVKNTNLDLFNIDALNKYIYEFNMGKKRGETYKKDLQDALPFLHRQYFARDNMPTLLGLLVCGNYVENYLQGRCEVNCYMILPETQKVAEDREIIIDNIIDLIERSFSFIWRNIQVGIAYKNAGTAEPEYPEDLIRESINNALAHRNYNTDRFVIIETRPNESLMIRNPGAFENRQKIQIDNEFGKIRRIIPISVARNPKLTNLLKIYRYFEGKGRGLTSLIDACLDNVIDVPYYVLTDGEIRLFIQKGRVYDDAMAIWLKSFSRYVVSKMNRELSQDEKIMLSFFRKSELLNRLERYTILLTMGNNHSEVIANLEEKGLIFKNPHGTDINPIYQVDKVLMKNDFSDELNNILGKEWLSLKDDYQQVLQAIHCYNTYAMPTESVSANAVGTFLYTKNNKNIIDLNDYENFKRKIRNIFNQLEEKKFIVRKDGKTKAESGKPDFMINAQFDKSLDLFSTHNF